MNDGGRAISRRAFASGALLVAAGSAAGWTSGWAPRASHAAGRRRATALPWTPIRDGAAYVTDPVLVPGGNVLAVPGESGTFVVDAKFAWLAGSIRADAESLSPTGRVALMNTHHHADHTSGNWAIGSDALGVLSPVLAHANAARRIAEQHARYISDADSAVRAATDAALGDEVIAAAQTAAEKTRSLSADAWAPSRELTSPRTEVEFGGNSYRVHHFGAGHTDGDLVFHAPDLNVVHTGDLVFNGLYPFCDQTGGVSLRGWIGSLWKAYELCDAGTIVVPGHGPIGTRGLLRTQADFHERLLDAVASDQDAGVSRADATAKTYPFMEGLGFEQIRPICIGAAYDEVARAR
ncbi:MAG: MBL fold metallo-hydrolase [Planctomycetota bacterium]